MMRHFKYFTFSVSNITSLWHY